MQPQGVFVQPPFSGTTQGPVEQFGLEGATITLPELSLRMPSIRFPGVSKTRQNARMISDRQVAPWQDMPAVPMGAAPLGAPMAAAPAQPAMGVQPQMAAPQQMMAAAPQQMMMMAAPAPQMMMAAPQFQMMMVPQQFSAPQPNIGSPPPPQPPADEPPFRSPPPVPSCDAHGNRLPVHNAEDRLRQLELAEQQLLHRMETLRRQLEQAEANRRVPTPTPDLGARATQLAPTPALRPTGIQPVQPISQQPQRPIIQPLPTSPSIYNERPASYASEPQMLPQYYQPQVYAQPQYSQPAYPQPQSQVIREPQASITGMRVR